MINYTQRWNDLYQHAIDAAGYSTDPVQLPIIEEFSRIECGLASQPTSDDSPLGGLFSRFKKKKNVSKTKGLYLFGSVGRGKTFLLDMFCEHVGFSVNRMHYHHFMKSIHDDLKAIKDQQNPLLVLADIFAAKYRVLCLDEFMVNDITDAMLLYGLLNGLIERGVVIITTTNIPPDDLYKNGLQRSRFLPAIELIKSALVIHEIGQGLDFRRVDQLQQQRFFSSLDDDSENQLSYIATDLSEDLLIDRGGQIMVNGREINFLFHSSAVVWFSFSDICEGFRSQLDYIEIASRFAVVIVSDIPLLDESYEESAKRFLLLIDELYDKRITLFLSSEVPVDKIYKGKKILFEYDRLQSRLFEMQSSSYGKQ